MKFQFRQVLLYLKRLTVILPLAWALYFIDLENTLNTIGNVPLSVVSFFFFALLIRSFIQSYRFHLLTKIHSSEIKLLPLFIVDMKARYYSTVIPSSIGQDIIRGAMLRKHLTTEQILSISLLFRITGFAPIFILSAIGLSWLPEAISASYLTPSMIVPIPLFIAAIFFLFSPYAKNTVDFILPRRVPKKYRSVLIDSISTLSNYRANGREICVTILISIVSQLIVVLNSSILLFGISDRWYTAELLSFIPLIELMSLVIPLGPNGLGVREGLSILLLSLLNRSNEEIFIYIAINSLGHLVNLVGIFAVMLDRATAASSDKI